MLKQIAKISNNRNLNSNHILKEWTNNKKLTKRKIINSLQIKLNRIRSQQKAVNKITKMNKIIYKNRK